jgi:hypothetical protein
LEAGKDPILALANQPKSKKMIKALGVHLQTNDWALLGVLDKPSKAKIKNTFLAGGAFNEQLFSEVAIPQENWALDAYAPFFFAFKENYVIVTVAHMGMMEARAIFEGTCLVAGVPYEAAPGQTMKEKQRSLATMGYDRLKTLIVESHGFAVTHDSTKLLVIPSGYLLLMASAGCVGVRWSMSGDEADTLRVKYCLTNQLASFPEVGAKLGYRQWLDWLNSMA